MRELSLAEMIVELLQSRGVNARVEPGSYQDVVAFELYGQRFRSPVPQDPTLKEARALAETFETTLPELLAFERIDVPTPVPTASEKATDNPEETREVPQEEVPF